ncbi:MAG: arylesterase [Alphaproteobacteria bacterium]|nr:arylesterase [Alphaproteobacteria bacterium]
MIGRQFKRIFLVAFGLLLASAPAFAAPVKILMLGTSLTQGYGLPPGTEIPVVLEAALKKKGIAVSVINAGVSGDTSASGLSRLDWSLADHPNAAIIELGSNDALRGIPPAVTRKNLTAILEKLKAAKIPVLLLGMMAPRNLGPDYAKAFDPIYPDLAKTYGALLYPFTLDGVAMNPKLNQADGIHPNPQGVKIVVGKLLPYAEKLVARVPKKTP